MCQGLARYLVEDPGKKACALRHADEICDILEEALATGHFGSKNIELRNRMISLLNEMERYVVRLKDCPCGGLHVAEKDTNGFTRIHCQSCSRDTGFHEQEVKAYLSWNSSIV